MLLLSLEISPPPPYLPKDNITIIAQTLSVFLLSLNQVEALPVLASKRLSLHLASRRWTFEPPYSNESKKAWSSWLIFVPH